MATLLFEDRRPFELAGTNRDPLRVSLDELREATGWERKPQGYCRDEACVAEPSGVSWYDAKTGLFDLAAFVAHLGQPVARDAQGVAAVGVAAARRREALRSLEAPDFELPDLDGRTHRLSDYRGKKVFLFTWGSY